MFDIGFSELVLVFIVGLVVLGPQRLPVAIRTVMGWINAIRNMANNVQNELKQELKLQELQESIKKAEQFNLKSLSPELGKTVEELKASAEKMKAELEQKAAETGQTLEQQAKQMREVVSGVDSETNNSLHRNTLAKAAETEKISEKSTALSSAEEAELAELNEGSEETVLHCKSFDSLNDYYPPDDNVEVHSKSASMQESHSRQTN